MSYEKHNFQSGSRLYARQLNEMDEQILKNDTTIRLLQNGSLKKLNKSAQPSDYYNGSYKRTTGTETSSEYSVTAEGRNWIVKGIRSTKFLDCSEVKTSGSVYFYISAFATNGTTISYMDYVGFYDLENDAWLNTDTRPKVYNSIDIDELSAKYPNYKFALNVVDISISNTQMPTSRASEITYVVYSSSPCMYDGEEIRVFNKGVCIGDSLTAGTFNYNENPSDPYAAIIDKTRSYPKKLSDMTGIELENLGDGGQTCMNWYNRNVSKITSGNDFAIIQLGVNDVSKQENGWDDISDEYLGKIIDKLKELNNGIKIFVATIIPSIQYSGTGFDYASERIRSFVENKDDSDVILLDMAMYGSTKDSPYNARHLTALGYMRLAMDYKAYISQYISTHLEEFERVQFIGTSHTYN